MVKPEALNLTLCVVINLAVALALGAFLVHQQRKGARFTVRVLTALALGVALGASFHWIYAADGAASPVIAATNAYLGIVGGGYVKLLHLT